MATATATRRPSLRQHLHFDRSERLRLSGLVGFIAFLHAAGFALFWYYNSQPAIHQLTDHTGKAIYATGAALAYGFGLRHAFDADHISAIDDTTRLMLQKGKKPLGVGFFFSLGHSTIVFLLSVGIAVATGAAARFQHSFQNVGGTIGASVSGLFLYLVAGINLVILVGIMRMWRQVKTGDYEPERLEQMLLDRGLMKRIFRGRFARSFDHSRQLYPVGVLFGLGFDTASEVGLLGLAAVGAAAGGLPPLAIIAYPLLFAAGMCLLDTFDGVFMVKAYSWAFTSPLRKVYYNITTTGLSVFVAFVIGTIELLGVLANNFGFVGVQPFSYLASIDLGTIGYFIVAAFIVAWIGSVLIWKVRRIEERYGGVVESAGTRGNAPLQ